MHTHTYTSKHTGRYTHANTQCSIISLLLCHQVLIPSFFSSSSFLSSSSSRLLPPSVYSVVLHAVADSSCRASTFHIITTSDVCGPEAPRLAQPTKAWRRLTTNEKSALERDSKYIGNSLYWVTQRLSVFVRTENSILKDCN